MQTRYTKTFKIEAVKKALSLSNNASMNEVAKTLGLPKSTLYGWVQAMKKKDKVNPLTSEGNFEKKPCQWTLEERFEAILATSHLSEEAVSEYCRKRGIFPHHLQTWKKEFLEGSFQKRSSEIATQVRAFKEEIKQLTKELRRKDKALAEAAALLVLKKKADEYWDLKEEI